MNREQAINFFKDSYSQNELSHAYLLECENQDVLNDVVVNVLLNIFCKNKNACGSCGDCLGIREKFHTQVYFLEKEKIKKQEIKDLILNLNISNLSENNKKIYVINNIENLSIEASNTLLKTLEEPPLGVCAFLLTKNRAEVISTIRSRCKLIYIEDAFEPLEENFLFNTISTNDKKNLFKVGYRLRKMDRENQIQILHDTVKKMDLFLLEKLGDDFYNTISNLRMFNNSSLIIENLIAKVYEVL